ncbi:MAG: TRAP transporter fused permease subunit [Armatimonadota bacterium]|nr:TRAP transporter fused permease subunit [Armatimonadota bacterium]MDR7388951.1 TRAP transporter fused permease subunit [Armatimonadota bacterium]MDR7393994.1 TRAP transporter fused permease subunit [Armatimonadota bacterium]MDR7395811.1 TRAP transporter fused permease subunit [Armatimonadota bacterium]MDR7398443.1 TRAP transporter fused permease subunit [Armatimonadota bacterium]
MRNLTPPWDRFVQLGLAAAVVYYLWTAAFGVTSLQYHRGVAVAYAFAAAFLLHRGTRRSPADRPSWADVLLAAAGCVVAGYWIVQYEGLAYRAGSFSAVDVAMGVVALALAVETTRRVLGASMTVVALLLVAYALWGNYLPSVVGHRGFSLRRVVEYFYLTPEGLFGVMPDILGTYILPFVAFGAFLMRAGVAKFFMDLSVALVGRMRGGPAQVAVVSSALFGSINGSPVANTATTGAFTIPLMKRCGFPPHIAAAVEAAASTGGMILPPVMGAGAFIMAELTQTPYARIAAIAMLPGLLYFLGVGVMVYCEARKLGLEGLPPEQIPRLRDVLKGGWYLLLPVVVLVAVLVRTTSASLAVIASILSTVAVSWLRRETRMGPRELWEALVDAGRNSTYVAAATGAIGIVVAVVTLTGIGVRFSQLVLEVSGGSLPVALLLVAAASFVLGMGMPITAAYLVLAVVAAPALVQMGIPLLSAHMIIFWLSLDSNITPPVALGAYTAAALAQADPWRTGWNSFRFAKMIYVMPVLFAYTHVLMTGTWQENLWAAISSVVGTVAFSIMSTAYFLVRTNLLEWLVLAAATVLCFIPTLGTDLAGIGLFVLVYLWQRHRLLKRPPLVPQPVELTGKPVVD